MEDSFNLKKAEEAIQLVTEARELLLQYSHFRNAGEDAIIRLQGILRAILQCSSLMQAYDDSPHRCAIYAHVSRTLLRVIDLPPDGTFPSSHRQHQQLQQYEMEAKPSVSSCEQEVEELGAAILYPPGSVDGLKEHGNTNRVRWVDVSGCEDAIAALKRATVLPLRFPHLFQGKRHPPRHILLYGPPGTGKTLLAAAAAAEYAAPLLTVSSADILSKWIGDSERQVRRVFEVAASFPRCVLFLDEIDAIGGVRGGAGESEASRRVKTELLLRMQKSHVDGITLIAATNIPWGLDSAILRRFDQLVFVGLPPSVARFRLIVEELRHVPSELGEEDIQWLVNSTEGYSASDICRITRRAVMEPIQKISMAGYAKPIRPSTTTVSNSAPTDNELVSQKSSSGSPQYVLCDEDEEGARPIETVPTAALHVPAVCRENFECALREFPPTTTSGELEKFLKWRTGGK
ncbi:vacuolar transport protein 4A [Trypanosoma brucei equiperdum]|uniref:Vacuolar transport protein 4A n=1 Tax=Trypanosoma brucei equiperdum TaxID=630700 RepID=A0A3L6L924_9TRYP|nr:vacuolar transport protein 4A [Trypanosoma brucei equiperdum]